jgi:hypothetical protein
MISQDIADKISIKFALNNVEKLVQKNAQPPNSPIDLVDFASENYKRIDFSQYGAIKRHSKADIDRSEGLYVFPGVDNNYYKTVRDLTNYPVYAWTISILDLIGEAGIEEYIMHDLFEDVDWGVFGEIYERAEFSGRIYMEYLNMDGPWKPEYQATWVLFFEHAEDAMLWRMVA